MLTHRGFSILRPTARLALMKRKLAVATETVAATPTPSSSSNELITTFATPSDIFYNQSNDVKQVDIPTIGSGDMGILARHVPAIGVLKTGVLTFYEKDGTTKRFIASSGTAVVNSDSSLQILAEEAFPIDKFDLEACKQQVSEWQAKLDSAKTETESTEAKIGLECADIVLKIVSKETQGLSSAQTKQ
ncbi:hypothetical protein ACOME3_000154 [Neoechinorhynchus agilis]